MRPRRSERHARPRRGAVPGGGGAEDRISALPTDLLLQILLRLRCVRAAARAALVSRRWRGLWALLPEIHLLRVVKTASAFDALLGSLASARTAAADAPPLALLHVRLHCVCDRVSTRLLASWLRRAARLAPEQLKLSVVGSSHSDSSWPSVPATAIELPCSTRTASMELELRNFNRDFDLAPPHSGDLVALERLALTGFQFDPAALLPRCPRLRVLEIGPSAQPPAPRAIHSPSLEELVVVSENNAPGTRLDVEAPGLKRLCVAADVAELKVSASSLEKLALDCIRRFGQVEVVGNMGQLRELMLSGACIWGQQDFLTIGYGVKSLVQQLLPTNLHRLVIKIALGLRRPPYDMLQKLPKTSILELQLSTYGHEFGGTVMRLLKKVEDIEELTILIDSPKETCSIEWGCCHQAWTWRSLDLSLPLLKRIEFKGFTRAHSAMNVLKVLFTSAKALQQITLSLCDKDSTDCEGLKQQLSDVFDLYPTVKCQVLDA